MAAISTYADYNTARKNAVQILGIKTGTSLTSNTVLSSVWTSNPLGGAAPSTAAVCNSSTTGAINKDTGAATNSLDMYLSEATGRNNVAGTCNFIIVDRLSHMGGLSGTTTGTITTNLPTAALTRYTSGVGVMAAVEIYATIGTTATAARISYTNQAGTSGKTSKDVVFGGSGYNSNTRLLPFPLADGDTGVRSVESITVDATTGTAGNYGITLFKPLVFLPTNGLAAAPYQPFFDPLIGGGGQFEKILSDACLCIFGNTSTPTGIIYSASVMTV